MKVYFGAYNYRRHFHILLALVPDQVIGFTVTYSYIKSRSINFRFDLSGKGLFSDKACLKLQPDQFWWQKMLIILFEFLLKVPFSRNHLTINFTWTSFGLEFSPKFEFLRLRTNFYYSQVPIESVCTLNYFKDHFGHFLTPLEP